jgi:hypothetical protein
VFAAEEKAHLAPPPQARFDVPQWSQAEVHPDHHAQVPRALYSGRRTCGRIPCHRRAKLP